MENNITPYLLLQTVDFYIYFGVGEDHAYNKWRGGYRKGIRDGVGRVLGDKGYWVK